MRLKKDTEYFNVLRVMADRIVHLSREYPLPPLAEIDPLDRVPNAFQPPPDAAASRAPLFPTRGSLCVQFAYIAARHEELQQREVRRLIDCYGDLSDDWKPYHPGRDGVRV